MNDFINSKNFQKVKWNLFGKKEIFIYNPKDIKQLFKNDGLMPRRPNLEPMVKMMKEIGMVNALANRLFLINFFIF